MRTTSNLALTAAGPVDSDSRLMVSMAAGAELTAALRLPPGGLPDRLPHGFRATGLHRRPGEAAPPGEVVLAAWTGEVVVGPLPRYEILPVCSLLLVLLVVEVPPAVALPGARFHSVVLQAVTTSPAVAAALTAAGVRPTHVGSVSLTAPARTAVARISGSDGDAEVSFAVDGIRRRARTRAGRYRVFGIVAGAVSGAMDAELGARGAKAGAATAAVTGLDVPGRSLRGVGLTGGPCPVVLRAARLQPSSRQSTAAAGSGS